MTKIDIFSGFLGAGKTTLIKKLLKEAFSGEKVVLIENEFGEIGIDGGFLADAGIEVTEMNSGCICCSLVGDFSKALVKVLEEYKPDRIIIEPSGVGKLSDVIKAVKGVETDEARLNCFTTVADAGKCKMYMKNFGEFYNDQIANASCIVLSHTGLVKEHKIEESIALIREHNADATVVTTPWDSLDGKDILAAMEKTDSLEVLIKTAEEEHRHEHEHHHEHDGECRCHEHHHEHDGECRCHEHHHEHDEECRCHEHHHEHDEECRCHEHHHEHDEECHCHEHHHEHDEECHCHEHHHEHDEECHCHEHHHEHDEECHCHEHHHEHDEECHCHEHHHEHDEECHCHEHHHEHDEECCCHEHHHEHDEECHCHEHHHEHDHEHGEGCTCGCHDHGHHHHADEVFASFGAETTKKFSREELESILDAFSESDDYGMILRAKGIVECVCGKWLHFDYVPGEADVRIGTPGVIGRLCVIGSGIDNDKIKELFGV